MTALIMEEKVIWFSRKDRRFLKERCSRSFTMAEINEIAVILSSSSVQSTVCHRIESPHFPRQTPAGDHPRSMKQTACGNFLIKR
jgi:hypothetical protein